MAKLLWLSYFSLCFSDYVLAAVLTDLTGAGWCRSWKFGVNFAQNGLNLIGLDGGLLAGDGDANNNYLVTIPLDQSIDLNSGANYHMSLIPTAVPKLKDQAFWSDHSQQTLFTYGGRAVSSVTNDDGVWAYDTSTASWSQQLTKPPRAEYGANTNVPNQQSAYWIGGYSSGNNIDTDAVGEIEVFGSSLLFFNTTSQVVSELKAGPAPVQNGALEYLPYGENGTLVFFGGETPLSSTGQNLTNSATPNAWNAVWVYDIGRETWYSQETSGSTPPSRTQFCTVTAFDNESSTHQIYVMGGADYNSELAYSDVYFLSIPSFMWYEASPLPTPLMSHTCELVGSQMFAVGGRNAWQNGDGAGCYTMPAFIYDLNNQVVTSYFDLYSEAYSAPELVVQDSRADPFPPVWADPALKTLFNTSQSQSNGTTSGNTTSSVVKPKTTDENSAPAGSSAYASTFKLSASAIVGIVVGAVIIFLVLIGLPLTILHRRRRARVAGNRSSKKYNFIQAAEIYSNPRFEIDHGAPAPRELAASEIPHELTGDNTWPRYELSGRARSIAY